MRTTKQHVDVLWPLWSILAEASERNPVRGCTPTAGVHMRPHVRRPISFMTAEAAEVVSRLIACASSDVTLFVNGVLSAPLSACGEITLPLVPPPFYSFNLTSVRQSWHKTNIPTGALWVRILWSLGLGCPYR